FLKHERALHLSRDRGCDHLRHSPGPPAPQLRIPRLARRSHLEMRGQTRHLQASSQGRIFGN
ncbi:hypothetical protein AVEN_59286-2-1, partial [Araneus ventricosus]